MTLTKEHIAMLQSYGRSFLGAALALYMSGVTDPYLYLNALIAAVAPVAIRYFNKNDIAFGKISGSSSASDVADVVTEAVKEVVKKAKPVATPPKKASSPAKKPAAKKTSTKGSSK